MATLSSLPEPTAGPSRSVSLSYESTPSLLPSSPLGWVLLGTGTCGFAGFCVGSAIGVKRNVPLHQPALATAFNSSLVAGTFFSFRQFIISPAFDAYDAGKAKASGVSSKGLEQRSRLDGLLRTAVAGACTGSLIRGLQEGRRVLFKAGFTTAVLTTTLHLACNEVLLLRARWLAPPALEQLIDSSAPATAPSNPSSSMAPPPATAPATAPERKPWYSWVMPLQRIPDEDRRRQLEEDIRYYEGRLQETDADIAAAERVLEQQRRQQGR